VMSALGEMRLREEVHSPRYAILRSTLWGVASDALRSADWTHVELVKPIWL